jgi:hypothetical protein
MRLPVLLLLLVIGMHYLPDHIAAGYANKLAAAKAWEYILGGAGGAALFLLVGLLARHPLAWPPVLWGAVEEGERAMCRLAKPIGGDVPVAELFSGLCGVEAYWLGVIAGGIIAVTMLDKLRVPK